MSRNIRIDTGKLYYGATWSHDGYHRYSLWRIWDVDIPRVAFIGLNPSTADERYNDPTVHRCQQFAARWGYGGLYMLNIFAYRATDPADMRAADDPVGYRNDLTLCSTAALDAVTLLLCCWGAHGAHLQRGDRVARMLAADGHTLACLGTTKHGHPRHPLYLRADVAPVRFAPWETEENYPNSTK